MLKYLLLLSFVSIAISMTDKDMLDLFPCLKCMETVGALRYAIQNGQTQAQLTTYGTLTYCNAFPYKCRANPQFGVFLYNEISRGTSDKDLCSSVCNTGLIQLLDELSKTSQHQ